ncbi:MAG: sigma-54-dependent Fis family transcriptional regulator, partial [Myxococcales bacterium]|nr:sigma-54-dependent Fis family transcriptional regulator [Myxococcales bacterium]
MLGRGPRRDMSEDAQKFELLADLGAMIAREVELDDLLATFAGRVATAMAADRATLWLVDRATGELRARVADEVELDALRLPLGRGVSGDVARTGEIVNLADVAADPRWARDHDERTGYRTESMLCVPVDGADGQRRGVVQVLNKRGGAFTTQDEGFARVLAGQIGRALDYTSLRGDGRRAGVAVAGRFNHVIGRSPAMQAVYDKILRAARTDATVLMHGETGTGKGLLARAIHVNGPRRDGPFVHVDCTTLPAGLVESELFGHERGAYTGADARVVGKVEAAAGGTLFLDEIGEIPLDLQGKLLRFVQERAFERVGGRATLTSDARIVAATNRDLAALVKEGKFRSDLYFRVRVVDVELPPLRRRGGDDILDLAEHFVAAYGRRYGKDELRLADDARPVLLAHRWPGNVRELEHAIERAVVLSDGGVIDVDALGLLDVDLDGDGDGDGEPDDGGDAAAARTPAATGG